MWERTRNSKEGSPNTHRSGTANPTEEPGGHDRPSHNLLAAKIPRHFQL